MVRKVKRKKSRISIIVTFLLMAVIVAVVYNSILTSGNQYQFEENFDDKTSPPNSFASIPFDSLNSPYAILIRLNEQIILKQKNSEEKIYPASLTKMVTAIVAIENLPNLQKEIKLTNSTFEGLYEANAAMAGFQPGEKVRAIDLLYGVLLPSGAESCIGLADQIAGSEQDFVRMLNKKAADLGMNNTHFTNAIGLHNENHYTTVKDLAILLSYALQNDTFRKVFTSSRYSTQSTNSHPDGITIYSTMFEELSNPSITGGEILGGKTGYTDEAGLCLASLAKVGKQEYLLITAGAKGDHYSEQYNITDAFTVYNSLGTIQKEENLSTEMTDIFARNKFRKEI